MLEGVVSRNKIQKGLKKCSTCNLSFITDRIIFEGCIFNIFDVLTTEMILSHSNFQIALITCQNK